MNVAVERKSCRNRKKQVRCVAVGLQGNTLQTVAGVTRGELLYNNVFFALTVSDNS